MVTSAQIERVVGLALETMAHRANTLTPYGNFTAAQIAAAAAADPLGETGHYLAQLIAWGIEWLDAFNSTPELLEVFGTKNARAAP